jgi:hypothetical protein
MLNRRQNMKDYNFPVYATQGGGLVRFVNNTLAVFVEQPDCPGLDVGDIMPEKWGIVPANQAARNECDNELPENNYDV